MRQGLCTHRLLAALVVLTGFGQLAQAVPYASGIRNTTGTTWEFILNQDASNVTVNRNGGNALNLGALTAGRHTFDMTGFTSFDVKVSNTASAGWTWVNDSTSLFDDFERPTGMAVNSNPANLAFFGTVYVNNSTTLATGTGRTMGDGLYSLSSDLKGIKLSDFSAEPSDTANIAYKPTSWNVASSNSAWRLALDEAGNVVVSDWSDGNGGMKWAARDFSDGGPLLNTQSGPTFGVENPTQPGTYMHGSIVSKPYVTGVLGTNLTVYGIDEDLESSTGAADGDNIWRWNVGNVKDQVGYIGNPTLVIDGGNIVDQANSPNDSAGTPWFENDGGHFADAFFSPQFNRWYISGASTYGNEKSSLLVVDATGAQPTVKWASKQFSIDHNLDGATDAVGVHPETAGINDILRDAWGMKMSADGKSLYVILSKAHGEANDVNPYIGPASTHVPGAVLIIPLDANGLPNIQINDNGTPGNTADDYITNIQSLPLPLPTSGNLDRVNIDVDAAGNVYATSNITEKLYVFSPGGNTLATTSWSGTTGSFSLAALAAGLAGDYNNDGKVDAADYVLWRNGGPLQNEVDTPGTVNAADYAAWRARFGNTAGSGSGLDGASVPEPTAVALLIFGIAATAMRRAKRDS